MNGICGKINFDSRAEVSANLINRMCDVIRHRGPDGRGSYVNKNVGLGNVFFNNGDIKIYNQVMSNKEQTIWVVFSGTIYNHKDLVNQLKGAGYNFYTDTDAELIIHLYEKYGLDSVKRLRGMFAYGLWDEKDRQLVLVRDRLGQQPLFYRVSDKAILFGSEIKSILEDKQVKREVNPDALHYYLSYLYVPAPLTAFKGIKKLLPAHYLVYKDGNYYIKNYWQLSFKNKLIANEEEYCERLWGLFTECTRLRLTNKGQIGIFLSGGVDSGGVVGAVKQLTNRTPQTFSIGYEDSSYNELPEARQTARYFGTNHHEFIVKPDIPKLLPELVWYYNEPFADASSIPCYYVSKLAAEHVKVVLTGDAGDENFAGYGRYFSAKLVQQYQKLPEFLRERFISGFVHFLPNLSFRGNFIGELKTFIENASFSQPRRIANRNSVFTEKFKKQIYTDDMLEANSDLDVSGIMNDYYNNSDADDLIDKLLDVDITSSLPDQMLVKVDAVAAANSLEVRSPFLDHYLVEFAASLPVYMKLRGKIRKYILKKTFQRVMPEKWLKRRKKGFTVPTKMWFRKELRGYIYEILLDEKTIRRRYFKREGIKKLLDEHVSGHNDHDLRIWSLLNLELWHRIFID